MHRFEIFDLETWSRGHSKSSEPTCIESPPMTSYKRSIVTMGLSRTVSQINGDFSQKSQLKSAQRDTNLRAGTLQRDRTF